MNHHYPCSANTENEKIRNVILSLILLTAMALPGFAMAQTQDGSLDWDFTIYGWYSALTANTQFPSGNDGPTIEVDADTLIDNLDFIFMAALQVRSQTKWGVFTDLIYLNEGASGNLQEEVTVGGDPLPADVTLDLGLDLKTWIWTLAPTYTVSESKTHVVDTYFGFRMIDIDSQFDYSFNGDIDSTPLPGRMGSVDAGDTNWDAVVGLKGYSRLGSGGKWMLPWQVDIGAGDSSFTWQAMAGIGYQFGWGATSLTYRYLSYDLGSSGALTDLTIDGPMIAATFNW